ncbi:MAG: DUF262 domain-containing protein [Odoribacter sp.]
MDNRVYYGEYSLAYWIELILKKNIELPEYQRNFVWEETSFKTLIESWKNKQFIPPITIGSYKSDDGNKNLIIDGQQRLTSILLAYLDRFPKREAATGAVEILANDNDDASDDDEEENENMLEWTFREFLAKGKNKTEILLKCSSEHYKVLNLNLDEEFFQKNYLGFSYLVPANSDTSTQQKFFSTVFRNINIQGKSLYVLESRASLYFLNSGLKAWFNPDFCKEISSSIVDKSVKSRMDFVRYVSLLSQYKHTQKINVVAYRYARKMEGFYEKYIYSVVNDEDSDLFGKFTDIYIDKNYSERMTRLNEYIDQLKFRNYYSSIIDMDIYFFGLIYFVLFEKNEIDLTRKENLLETLKSQIKQIKGDAKHTKTPSLLKYLRERITKSISIYHIYKQA